MTGTHPTPPSCIEPPQWLERVENARKMLAAGLSRDEVRAKHGMFVLERAMELIGKEGSRRNDSR